MLCLGLLCVGLPLRPTCRPLHPSAPCRCAERSVTDIHMALLPPAPARPLPQTPGGHLRAGARGPRVRGRRVVQVCAAVPAQPARLAAGAQAARLWAAAARVRRDRQPLARLHAAAGGVCRWCVCVLCYVVFGCACRRSLLPSEIFCRAAPDPRPPLLCFLPPPWCLCSTSRCCSPIWACSPPRPSQTSSSSCTCEEREKLRLAVPTSSERPAALAAHPAAAAAAAAAERLLAFLLSSIQHSSLCNSLARAAPASRTVSRIGYIEVSRSVQSVATGIYAQQGAAGATRSARAPSHVLLPTLREGGLS